MAKTRLRLPVKKVHYYFFIFFQTSSFKSAKINRKNIYNTNILKKKPNPAKTSKLLSAPILDVARGLRWASTCKHHIAHIRRHSRLHVSKLRLHHWRLGEAFVWRTTHAVAAIGNNANNTDTNYRNDDNQHDNISIVARA